LHLNNKENRNKKILNSDTIEICHEILGETLRFPKIIKRPSTIKIIPGGTLLFREFKGFE